jgi:hypothetical protein
MSAGAQAEGVFVRIRIVLALSVLAALLLAPAAAAARTGQTDAVTVKSPQTGRSTRPGHRVHVPEALTARDGRGGREAATSAPSIPERAALGSGTCTVTGTVLGYSGSPVANADVQWSYRDSAGSVVRGTWTQTDTSGRFAFSGVAVTNRGRLAAWSDNDDTLFRRFNLDFVPGANDYVLRPGAITVQATRSSDANWNGWQTMDVDFYGSGGVALSEITGASGQAYAMAPDVDYGVVSFWTNEAVEWRTASAIPVVTGSLSPTTVAVNEADALQVSVGTPYWASGKPGATIGYDLTNWPAGYKATFAGYDQNPDRDVSVQYPGEWTSTGGAGTVALAVPANATPGYSFDLEATRSDDLWEFTDLYIYASYQVCTLKASKTSVRKGASISVSGVIPTQDHWGAEAGISKTVTLYSHQGVAAVPTKWDPKGEGWKVVSTIKADGFGRYKSKTFKPAKTLTLVVRYPGDDWYWDAYTSVQKVTVK